MVIDGGLDAWLESCRKRACPRYRLRCALVDTYRADSFLSYPQAHEVGWNSHKAPADRQEYIQASDKKDVDDAMFHIRIEVLACVSFVVAQFQDWQRESGGKPPHSKGGARVPALQRTGGDVRI